MESTALVGETVPTPSRERSPGALFLAGLGSFAFIALLIGASVGAVILGGFVTPFHYYDAMVVIAVAIGPTLSVLALFAVQDGTMVFSVSSASPMKTVNQLCGLAFFLVLVPGNYILYANEAFNHSLADEQLAPVSDAWIRTGRHGHQSFMVAVNPSQLSPLGRWSFYGASQPVGLAHAEWLRAVARQSSVMLRKHPGRFGFPWYEADPKIAP